MNVEKRPLFSEDWLSLWIGLFVFVLSLGLFVGFDVLGWGIKTNVWINISDSISTVSGNFADLPALLSLLLTYLFMLIIVGVGLKAMNVNFSELILPFTIVFFISYICWLIGHYAYIAATSDTLDKFGISWSLNLTGEAGYIIALIVGLLFLL